MDEEYVSSVPVEELLQSYRDLKSRMADSTFDQNDAVELTFVVIELGRMGYILNADETDWVKED